MAKTKEPDNLSRESSQAIAAGMSYGQWKAMQYEKHKPVKVEKGIPEGWKICEYCGKPFKPTIRRPQKYCEIFCASRAAYRRQKEREAAKNGKAQDDRHE